MPDNQTDLHGYATCTTPIEETITYSGDLDSLVLSGYATTARETLSILRGARRAWYPLGEEDAVPSDDSSNEDTSGFTGTGVYRLRSELLSPWMLSAILSQHHCLDYSEELRNTSEAEGIELIRSSLDGVLVWCSFDPDGRCRKLRVPFLGKDYDVTAPVDIDNPTEGEELATSGALVEELVIRKPLTFRMGRAVRLNPLLVRDRCLPSGHQVTSTDRYSVFLVRSDTQIRTSLRVQEQVSVCPLPLNWRDGPSSVDYGLLAQSYNIPAYALQPMSSSDVADVLSTLKDRMRAPETPREQRKLRSLGHILNRAAQQISRDGVMNNSAGIISHFTPEDAAALVRKAYLCSLRGVSAMMSKHVIPEYPELAHSLGSEIRHTRIELRTNDSQILPCAEDIHSMARIRLDMRANDGVSLRDTLHNVIRNQPPGAWPASMDAVGEMVGVELEFVPPTEGYSRPDPFGVHVGYDSSVQSHDYDCYHGGTDDDGNTYDTEARVCFRFGKWHRLQAACRAFRSAGCVANRTCGLHVHLDMRGKERHEVKNIANRLTEALPILQSVVPSHRWRGAHAERYCYPGCSFSNRYHAINGTSWDRFQTLEVRMFSGSLNAEKIRHWIELLHFLAFRSGQFLKTPEDLQNCPSAPQHIRKWALARHLRFYPERFDFVEAELSE